MLSATHVRRTALAVVFLLAGNSIADGDALDRLQNDRLEATHRAVEELAAMHRTVNIETGYDDYRAILHAHSHLSHDSVGTIEEILDAARQVGVQVIMFTEHPADSYDFIDDGHQGLVDGVLLVPGAETGGFLAYPTRSIRDQTHDGPQQLCDLVRTDGGLIFLCHLEERMDWEIDDMTGMEIYNTHADVMKEKRLLASLQSPLTLLSLRGKIERYPREVFAALQKYPDDYLAKFDAACAVRPHTGVAANDAHHNQGIRAIVDDQGKLRIEDLLGEERSVIDPEKFALAKPFVADRKSGDVALTVDLDPYERSFGYVSTHLLMNEHHEAAVRSALRAGRAYVAFDWLGDPTGFVFQAVLGDQRHSMGAQLAGGAGLTLQVAATLPGIVKILRSGEVVHEDRARVVEFQPDLPGVYRAEVWLNVAGELRPWILSNPIYVQPQPE